MEYLMCPEVHGVSIMIKFLSFVVGLVGLVHLITLTDIETLSWLVRTNTTNSFEQQLLAGADPSDLLEAAAAGPKTASINCDDVIFGTADNKLFIRRYGDPIYLVKENGYKAFMLDETGFVAEQVPLDNMNKELLRAYEKCPHPEVPYEVSISFRAH